MKINPSPVPIPLGAIGVIEMRKRTDVVAILDEFIQRELWMRLFGRFIYAMPPFAIGDDDLATLTRGMVEVAGLV